MKVKVYEEIKEYCKILKLQGFLKNFEEEIEESEGYEDFLHKLLLHELEVKDQRAIDRRVKAAKFPYRIYLNDLKKDFLPMDMQQELPELSTLNFIEEGRNIIMTGNPGTGKTACAIALGLKACERGYKVLFVTIPQLVTILKENRNNETLSRYERLFEKYDLVIADELGYTKIDQDGANLLFNNMSLRVNRKSTIITTNHLFQRWTEVFKDPTTAAAMADRLSYRAIAVNMEGESYRLRMTMLERELKANKNKGAQ